MTTTMTMLPSLGQYGKHRNVKLSKVVVVKGNEGLNKETRPGKTVGRYLFTEIIKKAYKLYFTTKIK